MVTEPGEGRLDETRPMKPLTPNSEISHYRIMEKIGEGGMGVVYKATDTKLDRTVALKFLPPHLLCDAEARARFEHEAKAASALNHPGIATIYEIDEVDGQCFIAMEYLEGGSLKGLLKGKDIMLKEILDLAIEIGEGLDAAHQSGVVHRDLKPDNIMLTRRGRAKIMDFGLAKLRGVTRLTRTGTTLGTLRYMSPEQIQGKELDQRSDIFSFGVVLYEMVTRNLPFKGEYEEAVLYSILNETPDPLARYRADVPEGLQRIVDKALAKDVSERYQHADELVADLRHEKRLSESGEAARVSSEARARRSRNRLLRVLIPAAAVVAATLLLFVFEPFRIAMGPQEEASARENSLAIMYFENLPDGEDPEKLGEIVTNLLITDLSESRYMSVVSGQRIYDILKLLGKEGAKVVDRDVASEVATRAGARWMLLGSILQVEPQVILTARLVEVESGKVKASQRVSGEEGEQVFAVVDRLAVEIRNDLSLPAAAEAEEDRPVADVTTHSPEAYRHYLEGRDYDAKVLYDDEAEESYRKALEFDSTFAMAYYRLAQHTPRGESNRLLAKAVQYSAKASWKEQHRIRAAQLARAGDTEGAIQELKKIIERYPEDKEATRLLAGTYYNQEQYEEAVRYYERAIEIDPLYKLVYNTLAYLYNYLGNSDKSIWAINKYIALAPDEANPYDTRGDLYRSEGQIDQAARSYRKAVELKPDFYFSLKKLGHMYLFKREYSRAESCYQRLATSTDEYWRSAGRTYLADVPMYQGKFQEALAVLDDGIAADRMEKYEGGPNELKYWRRKHIYEAGMKNWDLALKACEQLMELHSRTDPDNKLYALDTYTRLLARNGDFRKAEEVANTLRANIDEKVELQMVVYWVAIGGIEWARGDYEALQVIGEKIPEEYRTLLYNYVAGDAYLVLGRLDEAVESLEKVLSDYSDSRVSGAIWAVKAHYLLGLAYEESGWDKKAMEQYEEFLDIWNDADPGIPEIEDARQRLAHLKSGA